MDYFCNRYENQTRTDRNPRFHCGLRDLPARIRRPHLACDPQFAAYRTVAGSRHSAVEFPEKHDPHGPRRRDGRSRHPRGEDSRPADQFRTQLRPERPELGRPRRPAPPGRNPPALRGADRQTAHRPDLRAGDRRPTPRSAVFSAATGRPRASSSPPRSWGSPPGSGCRRTASTTS